MDDITPELLKKIQEQFRQNSKGNSKLTSLIKKLDDGKATYLDANDFAIEIGNILSKSFQDNLSSEILPNGRMYYNIANRLLNPTLKNNYELISGYSKDVQQLLNKQAKIGIKAQVPKFNQNRVDGLVNRISSESDFDKIKWILGDSVVNFSQSVVDDSIEDNAKFHEKSGMHPQITRKVVGKACDWCSKLAGTYSYPEKVPKDVYRRHANCRCMVNYIPQKGKAQNIWDKDFDVKNPPSGLQDAITGNVFETTFKPVTISKEMAKSLKNQGWNFDWSSTDGQVYKLCLKGSTKTEGLISFYKDSGYNFVDLVESSPYNRGSKRRYYGAGQNLFAIAAKDSLSNGNDGFVSFKPKTNLIQYYIDSLNAQLMANGNMFFDTSAAQRLVDIYFKKG